MKIHNKVQSKKKLSQRFNLKELLGYSPSVEQKELFYNLAVDKIVNRTASGKDIDNANFTPYSKDYAEKKGVSRNSVDLILTGEMLSSFEENQKQPNMVEIKIEGEVAKRSYNHDTGDTLPKREFFGFKKESDIIDIISTVDSIKDQKAAPTGSVQDALDLVALRSLIQESLTIETIGFDGGIDGNS